jgi:hypothetical protein
LPCFFFNAAYFYVWGCCADSPAGKNMKKQRLASIVILV